MGEQVSGSHYDGLPIQVFEIYVLPLMCAVGRGREEEMLIRLSMIRDLIECDHFLKVVIFAI